MGRPALTIIHINKHIITSNIKNKSKKHPITFKRKSGGKASYTSCAVIVDENGKEVARVVYRPDNPLGCGARCWIETRNKVVKEEELESSQKELENDKCISSCSLA